MGQIIGPIPAPEWAALQRLNSSIAGYKRLNNPIYDEAIRKESLVYRDIKKDYVN